MCVSNGVLCVSNNVLCVLRLCVSNSVLCVGSGGVVLVPGVEAGRSLCVFRPAGRANGGDSPPV